MARNTRLKKILNDSGFTMVELVIVIVLIGIIAMTASLLIGQAAQTYQKEDDYSAVLNQGRLALERMAREIRMIKSPADILICSSSDLKFNDMNGNSYEYRYVSPNLTEIGSLGSNILASNINGPPLPSFNITYRDSTANRNAITPSSTNPCAVSTPIWLIEIDINPAQGGENLPLRIMLHPRNF